jgi:hypothetical protein
MISWPFTPDGIHNKWRLIDADGFPNPAPGCIYSPADKLTLTHKWGGVEKREKRRRCQRGAATPAR